MTGRGVDFSFNTTTVPEVHTMALEVLAMNGTAGFVAAPHAGNGRRRCSPCSPADASCAASSAATRIPACSCPQLVDYWRQGRFPFDRLLTFYPFAEIDRAFADAHSGKAIKPVLLIGEPSMTPIAATSVDAFGRNDARAARRDREDDDRDVRGSSVALLWQHGLGSPPRVGVGESVHVQQTVNGKRPWRQ